MRIIVATAWAAAAADIEDPKTAEVLTRVFAALQPHPGQTPRQASVVVRVTPTGPGFVEVRTDSGGVRCRTGMDAAVAVATAINGWLLGACPHLAMHAAVVSTPAGALAFPAASGAGKSTLAAACLRAGFGYVSDEALVLTPQATVVPYQRPLALSPWSLAAIGLPAVDELSGNPSENGPAEVLVDPLSLGRVPREATAQPVRAVLRLRRGSGGPSLSELPRSDGLVELLTNCFNHYRDPGPAVELAHSVVLGAQVLELTMGDPISSAQLVASSFGT